MPISKRLQANEVTELLASCGRTLGPESSHELFDTVLVFSVNVVRKYAKTLQPPTIENALSSLDAVTVHNLSTLASAGELATRQGINNNVKEAAREILQYELPSSYSGLK